MFITSDLTLIEAAGVARRYRNSGKLTEQEFNIFLAGLTRDLAQTVTTYKISDYITVLAMSYSKDYGLRGGDAIHLGTAVRAGDLGYPQPIIFVASDKRLISGAEMVGISFLNPEDAGALERLKSLRRPP